MTMIFAGGLFCFPGNINYRTNPNEERYSMSIPTQTTLAAQPSFDGQRLRRLRHKRGLSVRKLAKQADLCTRQIWRMEAGHRPNVRAITLAQVARVLETSIDYLMGLTDRPEPYECEDPGHTRSAG